MASKRHKRRRPCTTKRGHEKLDSQGMRIRNLVTAIMQARGDEVTEREIYRYASKNYYDLFEETSLSAG